MIQARLLFGKEKQVIISCCDSSNLSSSATP